MAGDWLKMEVDLPEKPEVWQIASIVGIDADSVVGKLLKVWRWFDAHTEDGVAKGSAQMLDAICGAQGFADAMVAAGWLSVADGRLCTVNFDKHNGKTGKARAETARRVAKHREAGAKHSADVTRKVLPRPLVSKIKLRDGACVYCGRKEGEYTPPETSADAKMCIDHVIPLTKGGTDDERNLVCACSSCNQFKSDRTPEECGLEWPMDACGNKFGVTHALPREEKRREEDKSKSAGADLLGASKGNPEGRKSSATEIDTWLRSLDGDAIPADDPIFSYAENAGIPLDFLELSWHRFVEDMRERGKRQKDWRAHYRNAVKGNWLKLWWLQDGEYRLTTAGEQAKRARA